MVKERKVLPLVESRAETCYKQLIMIEVLDENALARMMTGLRRRRHGKSITGCTCS